MMKRRTICILIVSVIAVAMSLAAVLTHTHLERKHARHIDRVHARLQQAIASNPSYHGVFIQKQTVPVTSEWRLLYSAKIRKFPIIGKRMQIQIYYLSEGIKIGESIPRAVIDSGFDSEMKKIDPTGSAPFITASMWHESRIQPTDP